MDFGPEWDPDNAPTSSPEKEDRRVARYIKERGGLLFTQVNATYTVDGWGARYIDGLRFIDPPQGDGEMYSYDSENRETIWRLLENHRVEVIEAHDWGLDVFGQCLGKADIIEKEFNPPEVERTVIVVNGPPDEPAVEQVYEEFGVDWIVIDV